MPFAFATGQTRFHGAPLALASLIFQTIAVAFVSYLVWFWLLRRYFAARLGVLSFMTPLFGVAMGVLLLREHVDAAFLMGSALVLAGLLIVNGQTWLCQMFVRGARYAEIVIAEGPFEQDGQTGETYDCRHENPHRN